MTEPMKSPGAAPIGVSPHLRLLLRLCALAYVLFALGKHGVYRPLTIHGVDYPKHWFAARAVLESRSTYINLRPDDDLWLAFNYPQWSAMATCWLAFIDRQTAEHVWKMMHLAGLILAWLIAWRIFAPGHGSRGGDSAEFSNEDPIAIARGALAGNWGLASAVIVAAYSPAGASSLYIGQIDPANALLAMAFVGALLAGWERTAGVYFAMLCLVKMIPVFLLLPLLLWRRWRVAQGWLAFMAAYLFVLVASGRLKYEWFFVHDMAKEIPFHWKWISGSIHRFIILKLMPEPWHDTRELFDGAVLVITAGLLAAYSAAIFLVKRRGWDAIRAIEVGLLFIPLFSPLFEPHHMAWAMPVLFLQVRRWARGEMRLWAAAALAPGWAIVLLDYFFYNMMQAHDMRHQYYVTVGAIWIAVVAAAEAIIESPPGTPISRLANN